MIIDLFLKSRFANANTLPVSDLSVVNKVRVCVDIAGQGLRCPSPIDSGGGGGDVEGICVCDVDLSQYDEGADGRLSVGLAFNDIQLEVTNFTPSSPENDFPRFEGYVRFVGSPAFYGALVNSETYEVEGVIGTPSYVVCGYINVELTFHDENDEAIYSDSVGFDIAQLISNGFIDVPFDVTADFYTEAGYYARVGTLDYCEPAISQNNLYIHQPSGIPEIINVELTTVEPELPVVPVGIVMFYSVYMFGGSVYTTVGENIRYNDTNGYTSDEYTQFNSVEDIWWEWELTNYTGDTVLSQGDGIISGSAPYELANGDVYDPAVGLKGYVTAYVYEFGDPLTITIDIPPIG